MTDPSSTDTGRLRAASRRSRFVRAGDQDAADRLMSAAAKLIAERGTTTFSFAEVAKVAGVAPGLPSQLFGTKVALLCALIEDFDDRIRRNVLAPAIGDARGLEAVERAVRVIVAGLGDPWPQARALTILLGDAQGADPELQAAVNRYHAGLRDMVAGWLREGIADGEVRPGMRPDAQAAIVIAIIRGLSYQLITDPFAVPVEDLEAEVLATFRLAFRA